MKEFITKDKEFNILSRKISNASKCAVTEVCKDCFKVKLNNIDEYELNEAVELFTMTENGQLYFESIVKEIEGNILSVWFPLSYKYLQKREYTRVPSDKEVTITYNNEQFSAPVINLSAGGIKLKLPVQFELTKEYKIKLSMENTEIEAFFEPIRIETAKEGGFIASGRFKNLSSRNRIELVQYCFRKQIEYNNK